MDPVIVRVPKLYENMDEATIGEWLVEEGAEVAADGGLVELVTDKTIQELVAPSAGILRKQFAAAKSTLPVGAVLAVIGGEPDQDWSELEAENAKLCKEALAAAGIVVPAAAAPKPVARKPRVAPAARALVKKHGLDLDVLAAAVGDRVIHKKDVLDWLQANEERDESAESAAAATADGAEAPTRVALVTGAGGAIGTAIAKRLAKDGFTIAVHYRASVDEANDLVSALRDSGVEAAAFQADLTDAAAAAKLIEAVLARFNRLDVLVNNAGLLDDAVMAFMKDEQWHGVMDANLNGAFYLMRAAAMPMARARGGRIVNIASDAGRLGAAGRSNYAAAKAGLVGLTKSAALELASSNVQVNAVSPGFVESKMTEVINDAKRKDLMRRIPARRFGQPEEIAELVAYLCSPLAAYLTGQEISIDGGLYIG